MSYQIQVPQGRVPPKAPTPASVPSMAEPPFPSSSSVSVAEGASQAAGEEAAPKEDWVLQMEMLGELEAWTKIGEQRIPASLKVDLLSMIESFPGLQRIDIYTLLDAFYWDLKTLAQFTAVMQGIEQLLKMPTMLFLKSLVPPNLHHQCLQLFHFMTSKAVMDFVHSLSQPQGQELSDIAKYLPDSELIKMARLLDELGAQQFHRTLQEVKLSPLHKNHCNHCRTKRVHQLEFRMHNKQVPENYMSIPALLHEYHHPDHWAAADAKQYSFDALVGKIYWHRQEVDLVQICDACVEEVHTSVSSINLHVPVFQLSAPQRKLAQKELFEAEASLSAIIAQIAHTRALRRLREFVLSAVQAWQHGKAEEQQAAFQRHLQAQQRQAGDDKRDAHRGMVQTALLVDARWKALDRQSDLKALQKRMNFALVQKHMGFTTWKPAPRQRKHAMSWQLKDFDDEGLPLTAEAAQKMFGHEVAEVEVDRTEMLTTWRTKADEKANLLQQRRAAIKAAQRAEELRKFEELKDYVRERLVLLECHRTQMVRVADQAEEDRLAKRAADRQARREARFLKYLDEERACMKREDRLSGEMRFLLYEKVREQQERGRMWEEETAQCERDRFWGLDFYENRLRQEEVRLRRLYEQRIQTIQAECCLMGITRPAKTTSMTAFGSLPEDHLFEDNQARRLAVIKKLKAEEVRSKLKVRLPTLYPKG